MADPTVTTNTGPAFDALAAREQVLSDTEFVWQNNEVLHFEPYIPNEPDLPRKGGEAAAANEHISDPKLREAVIASYVAAYAKLAKEWTGTSQYQWILWRTSDKMVVAGTAEQEDFKDSYTYVFGKSARMIIDSRRIVKQSGTDTVPDPVYVFATQPESWRYRYPSQSGLQFGPEDLCLLTGVNPLNTYGISWRVLSDNSSTVDYTGECDYGDDGPLQLKLTLDKTHNYCPISMSVTGGSRTESYGVTAFTHVNGVWAPSQVTSNVVRDGNSQYQRRWSLISTKPRSQFAIRLNANADCIDYRLLGQVQSTAQWLLPMRSKDVNVVTYRFKDYNHDLPNLDKLKALRDRMQNIRAPSNLVNKPTSVTLIEAGILAVAVGVFLARRKNA